MSTLTKNAFEVSYSDPAGTFADNTTRLITESQLRQFAQDIADSLFGNAGALNFIVVNIGDWNMDSTASINVAHGLPDHTLIRSVSVVIISDAGSYLPIYRTNPGGSGGIDGYVNSWDATNINLGRFTGGIFDSTSFDQTSFNRGFITIGVEL